jgi:hypothetical protein
MGPSSNKTKNILKGKKLKEVDSFCHPTNIHTRNEFSEA